MQVASTSEEIASNYARDLIVIPFFPFFFFFFFFKLNKKKNKN